MSTGAIVLIAILVAVFLAFLMVVTTARRRDQDKAIGRLSQETLDRDKSDESAAPTLGDIEKPKGRDVERAAKEEEAGAGLPVPAEQAQPPMLPPMDPQTIGVTRRQFLNRGIVTGFGLGLGGFGLASLAFLWPSLSGGFGSKIKAGALDEILTEINDKRTPFYSAEGRFYINPYPKEDVTKAKAISAY